MAFKGEENHFPPRGGVSHHNPDNRARKPVGGADHGEASSRGEKGCLSSGKLTQQFSMRKGVPFWHLWRLRDTTGGTEHDQALREGWACKRSSGSLGSSLGKWIWPRTTGRETTLSPLIIDRENEAQEGRT